MRKLLLAVLPTLLLMLWMTPAYGDGGDDQQHHKTDGICNHGRYDVWIDAWDMGDNNIHNDMVDFNAIVPGDDTILDYDQGFGPNAVELTIKKLDAPDGNNYVVTNYWIDPDPGTHAAFNWGNDFVEIDRDRKPFMIIRSKYSGADCVNKVAWNDNWIP